jgi:hypothetical protein
MQKHMTAKRALAALLCVCVAAAFLFSAWFITANIHHDCTGHDCATCAQVSYWARLVQKMSAGLALLMLAAAALALPTRRGPLGAASFLQNLDTLVGRKVQMNN